jgi:hypothetical protein
MAMKLTATMMVTVDGVYQGPGGPDEDRRGGFERADALLLGRRTWEIFEKYWPRHDGDPVSHEINVLPKYVPSSTLKDPGVGSFPERGQTHDLTLVESRSTPSGVTVQTYRPAGRATLGTAAP